MSARLLPLAWVPTIGGLVCDVDASALGQVSAFPRDATDHGITRFPADDTEPSRRGRWMVVLPMGVGLGPTLPRAMAEARVRQHEAIRAERELGIADATEEHARARARRLCGDLLEMRGHSSCEHRGDALEVES